MPWGPVALISVSHWGGWALLFGLALWPAARWLPRAWFRALAVTLLTAGLLILYADVTIYRLFRFHLNSLVVNVLFSGSLDESADVGWQSLATFTLVGVALVAIQLWFFARAEPRLQRLRSFHGVRPRAAVVAVVLLANLADKALYAWSDLANRPGYLGVARIYPLYIRATMKRFAERRLGVRIEREEGLAVEERRSLLAYPPVAPGACGGMRPPGPSPNILVIVVDGVRADLLTEAHAPHLTAWSRRWWNYTNHFSGGNATRFGLFAIMYGLHATYWDAFLAERRGPALVEALRARDYDFKVISTTRLTWPELRKTAFVAIPDAIEDHLGGIRPAERDAKHPARFREFLDHGRRPGRPFFAFDYVVSPHAPYDYPAGREKFLPSATHVNYAVATWQGFDQKTINRYYNAVLFGDAVAGELIEALERRGLLDSTIVVLTSDHGEEFNETGHWGHTSAFSRFQVQVPLLVHYPGRGSRRVSAPTSNVDVAPTLLELAGCAALAASHTTGRSLLRPGPRPHRVITGWHRCGVWAAGAVIAFNTDFKRKPELGVFDEAYRPLEGTARATALAAARPALRQVLDEQRRFLK
mgnify:CR=1 FL=1